MIMAFAPKKFKIVGMMLGFLFYGLVCTWIFNRYHLWLKTVTPLAGGLSTVISISFFRFISKRKIKEKAKQALGYAKCLDIPFVYSSNGDAFLEHDKTIKSGKIEKEIPLDSFPSPADLWSRYKQYKGIKEHEERIIAQDYFFDQTGKKPRYYQAVAINRIIEAIAQG